MNDEPVVFDRTGAFRSPDGTLLWDAKLDAGSDLSNVEITDSTVAAVAALAFVRDINFFDVSKDESGRFWVVVPDANPHSEAARRIVATACTRLRHAGAQILPAAGEWCGGCRARVDHAVVRCPRCDHPYLADTPLAPSPPGRRLPRSWPDDEPTAAELGDPRSPGGSSTL